MKIKKGDTVKILSGKDRGKRGVIARALPEADRIVVEGINLRKRHRRSRRQDRKGEIILIPAPLAASAVQLVCPSCGKPTRVGYTLTGQAKTRTCKRCRKPIP